MISRRRSAALIRKWKQKQGKLLLAKAKAAAAAAPAAAKKAGGENAIKSKKQKHLKNKEHCN